MRRPEPVILQNPLNGWVSLSGVLELGQTVAAYDARQQRVIGTCHSQACKRRVVIDPTELCQKGYGQLGMMQVRKLAICHHIDGCTLLFRDEKADNPLTLRYLVGKANARLRVVCQTKGCKHARIWRVEEMIEGLRKHQSGGDFTDVTALSGLMKAPCPLCKGAKWAVKVLMADPNSPAWRAQGDRYFDNL